MADAANASACELANTPASFVRQVAHCPPSRSFLASLELTTLVLVKVLLAVGTSGSG